MLSLILAFSFFTSEIKKDDDRFYQYLEFLRTYDHLGEIGNYKDGKIEIVTEEKTVRKIEETQAKSYMKEGETEKDAYEHAKVGIVAEDKYWVWVRDAVIFPSGGTGTFDRIIKSGSLDRDINNSVAVLPVDKEGKILLNLMYRHAIRNWVIEIPRGKIEKDETALHAAKRELREETGIEASRFDLLGEMTPDSGTVSSRVPVYIGYVDARFGIRQDYSEAIVRTVKLSVAEIKEAYSKGFFETTLNKKKVKAFVKDSYLSYALLVAQQKKLI
jgi:ADP-ribose pyrophosphatase